MKNGKNYQPPLIMTPEIFEMTDAVAGKMERVRGVDMRTGRVRAIRGSLAIEGNSLREDQIAAVGEGRLLAVSAGEVLEEQIAAIRDGRLLAASAEEIREVRNALIAYDQLEGWTPHEEEDLLAAHGILMGGLLDDAGHYRKGAFKIASGTRIIHVAPPAERVPELMEDLMDWLRRTELHPLVAAAAFHYEFEFIHPFADGSGRLGRLWQATILRRWNPMFADIPVESALLARRDDYFLALRISTRGTNCAPFVEFMLSAILDTLDEYAPATRVAGTSPASKSAPQSPRQPEPAGRPQKTQEPSRTPFSGPTYLEVDQRHLQAKDGPQIGVLGVAQGKRAGEATPSAAPEIAGQPKTPFSEATSSGVGPICHRAQDGPQNAVLDASEASEPDELTPHTRRLLEIVSGEMSGQELQEALGLRDRKSFRERYVTPALLAGVIEMTVPDKPNSRLQKYRLTSKGSGVAQS